MKMFFNAYATYENNLNKHSIGGKGRVLWVANPATVGDSEILK